MKKLLSVLFVLFSIHYSFGQINACGTATDEPPGCHLCGPVYTGSTEGFTGGPAGLNFPCGTVTNNQWLSIITGTTTMSATILASNCQNNQGLQLIIYDNQLNPVSTCFSNTNNPAPGNVVASGLIPGETYWIMVGALNNDICDFTLTVIGGVSVAPPDATGPITQTPDVSPLCPGATACFSIDRITNATFYEWEVPANATILSGGGPDDTEVCVRFNSPGSGVVRAQASNECFPGTVSLLSTVVLPIPITTVIVEVCAEDLPIPGTQEVLFTSYLGCDSLVRYIYFPYPSTPVIIDTTICAGSGIYFDTFFFDTPGLHTITLPDADVRGCDSIIMLNISELADLEILNYDPEVDCVDSCTTLSVNANMTANFNLEWSTNNGLLNGPIDNLSSEACAPGKYFLTFADTLNGGSCSVQTNVTSDSSMLDTPILTCFATTTSITIDWDHVPGAHQYLVSVNGVSQGIQTGTTFQVTGLDPEEDVEFEVTAFGDCNSSSAIIVCSSMSCPPVSIQINATLFCADDPGVNLPADVIPGTGCGWSGPGVSNCRFEPSVAGAGTHRLYWNINDNGCIYSDSVDVVVSSLPVIEADINFPIWHTDPPLAGINIRSITGGMPPFQYLWSNGANTRNISNLSSGQYCVTVIDQNQCSTEECYTVGANGIYRISNLIILCQGDSRQLSIRPSRGADFSWSPANGLSCSDCPNPVVSVNQTTVYEVTATLPNGQSSTTSVLVLVLPPPFCPTSLKDGNDAWKEAAVEELRKLNEFSNLNDLEIKNWLEKEADFALENQVRIYPNPFRNEIRVETNDEVINEIEIFDLTGKIIKQFYPGSPGTSLPLEALKAGSYYIRVKTGEKTHIDKILKI